MTANMPIRSVLFVCMGNICRSPTAQGVVEQVLRQHRPPLGVALDSAGTHAYHVGHAPDGRSQAAAQARGYDLSSQRARQVKTADFERFDLVLAMDRDNLTALQAMAPPATRARVELLLSLAGDRVDTDEVPDPYYGDALGFERVLDLIEHAATALLEEILRREAE